MTDADENKYLLFHDPKQSGHYLAMTQEDATDMYQKSLSWPVQDKIETYNSEVMQGRSDEALKHELGVMRKAVESYGQSINYKNGVVFGTKLSLDEIGEDGLISVVKIKQPQAEIPSAPTVQGNPAPSAPSM